MNNQWRDNANHMVVWGDGTYDTSRKCDECQSMICGSPVHNDHYKEIGSTHLEEIGEDGGQGYWDYMHSNQPLGGKFDFDGELMVKEFYTANPDGLDESKQRGSGVSEEIHELAQDAFSQLTPKQQQVWQLVMREQMSQTDAATKLGITQQMVEKHLRYAKTKFTEYLRENDVNVGA